jgi:hypothetical protein
VLAQNKERPICERLRAAIGFGCSAYRCLTWLTGCRLHRVRLPVRGHQEQRVASCIMCLFGLASRAPSSPSVSAGLPAFAEHRWESGFSLSKFAACSAAKMVRN